jgi:prepilin-type N-terminal cleavage/methylation domain-containing protein
MQPRANIECGLFGQRSNRQPQWAFSLVELLVVIAIVAILAALLLPSLAKSKMSSQEVYCLNNLKQLQAGWEMYVGDYSESLPLNWQEKANYSDNASTTNSWVVGDTTYSTDLSFVEAGSMYPYLSHPVFITARMTIRQSSIL